MKKFTALMLGAVLAGSCVSGLCFSACNQDGPSQEEEESTALVKDKSSLKFAFNELYKAGEMKDAANGLSSLDDVKGARFKVNNRYRETFTEAPKSIHDAKVEFFGESSVRVANISGGFAFTLPTTELKADYTTAKFHSSYEFGDSVLTVSRESSNPYTSAPTPWYTYCAEWIIRFINDDEYIKNCNLTRTNDSKAYEFTSYKAFGDTTTKPGFDLYRYDVKINDYTGEDALPYYNIAVIRKENDPVNFVLFVMKSKSERSAIMDSIVQSYTLMRSYGTEKNFFDAGDPKENPNWSDETKAFFRKLCTDDYINWGAFSWSMPGDDSGPGNPTYDAMLSNSLKSKAGVEEIWGHGYDIYPTYTHLSWYSQLHYFPKQMAKTLANGNGLDDKPVLQFTYQFTTDNNNVGTIAQPGTRFSPLFDIMRGKYDEHFRRLAADIKEYGKPVLFRLNNEMNTDWTSYCGMLTLLDPEIFNITWRRLYDIFEEEGVDNAIWIWNPIETSSPYSSWGEDINYFPGVDYVQLLGGTNYEMNNYTKEAAEKSYKSFRTCYKAQYEKNKDVFSKWFTVIAETACGSGGNATGELGRNAAVQAKYVREMFDVLYTGEKEEWATRIKGIIWFNCNDIDAYAGTITNRLCFYFPEDIKYDYPTNNNYADLAETWAAFKEGFQKSPAK